VPFAEHINQDMFRELSDLIERREQLLPPSDADDAAGGGR
jgi:hypothetical protein